MKTLVKQIILVLAISFPIMFGTTSCKKSFFTDANNNPNAPPSVTPGALLTSAEVSLAYTQNGTFDLFVTLFDQQTQGISRQAAAYYGYTVTSQDLDDPWSYWYTTVMNTMKDLMTQADAKGYNEYSGIARLLMAYSLQVTVDVWGYEPYSQAFKGPANLNPSFDSDAGLYTVIGNLVSDGITKLNASPGNIVPGGDDVIYGGNAASWIKFGHAINARLAIHQSKGNAAMATTALTEIGSALAGAGDIAQVGFGTTESNGSPWYQFNEERGGDVSFTGSTLATMMAANSDPRYQVYFDSTFKDLFGVGLGAYYGVINSPVELITYEEMLFMSAEAKIRATSNISGAQTDYQAAITANMTKLGVAPAAITAYVTAHGALPSTSDSAIAQVSKEEYTALYLNPEAYTLWRRTGSPVLTATAGNLGVPRRLRYPQTEYTYNATNVDATYNGTGANVTLWAPKLFWDN